MSEKQTDIYECGDCGHKGERESFDEITADRMFTCDADTGAPYTHRTCPECGACAYPAKWR